MRSVDPQDPVATYAAVLDALPIVAYMARADGTIAYVSRGWEELTGRSTAELQETGLRFRHPSGGSASRTWSVAGRARRRVIV